MLIPLNIVIGGSVTDQKSLIKTATSLKRVEKSVATVDKLLAKGNEELIQLLLRHPDFFVNLISYKYPLSKIKLRTEKKFSTVDSFKVHTFEISLFTMSLPKLKF